MLIGRAGRAEEAVPRRSDEAAADLGVLVVAQPHAADHGQRLALLLRRPLERGAELGVRADPWLRRAARQAHALVAQRLVAAWRGRSLDRGRRPGAPRRRRPLRFRCQVGHAYSADSLAKEQEGRVDEALRVALRIIEERAELVKRMADEGRSAGRRAVAEMYDERAEEYRRYAETLRKAALDSLAPPGDEPD